jgi:hypothetical protein
VVARTRKEEALAGLRELELEEKRGNLLTIDYADGELERAFGIVRAKLLNLPGIAPRLVGLDSIAKIQEAIQQEVDDMLRALSRAGEWDDDEDDDEGDDDDPDGPDGEDEVGEEAG